MGLRIAENLVVAHGDEIFVESEAGKGTTIWFRLPTWVVLTNYYDSLIFLSDSRATLCGIFLLRSTIK